MNSYSKVKFTIVLFCIHFIGLNNVSGYAEVMVELRAPRFVVFGNNATLRCEHNVDPDTLYKVVFYKDGQRMMKYVRGRIPPYEIYNSTTHKVNMSVLSPTAIALHRMEFTASGAYGCEIALETPLYSKLSRPHEIIVIVRQKHRPKIKIKHKKIYPHEELEATCHSAYAYPAPHLTWFINNAKVDEKLTVPHGTFHRSHGAPLAMTNSSLFFPLTNLQLFPNQTVDVTCLSTIPSYASVATGYADVQNMTISVNVVMLEPAPTQLPIKIVSSQFNRSPQLYTPHLLCLYFLFFLFILILI